MFTSAAQALDWAYNTEARSIINPSAVNGMRKIRFSGLPNDILINLTPLEAHGQAAQIIGMVENLSDPAGREYLAAKFGYRVSPSDLSIVVLRGCAVLGTGVVNRQGVYRVMRAYFGGNMSVRTLRRELGCRHLAATIAKSKLYDVLDLIHDSSMAEITRDLERHGLIESVYA